MNQPANNKTNGNKTRLIFMGTPDFAVPGLQALLNEPNFDIVGVFTQTDKPVGRKQLLTPPPIKTLSLANKIRLFQPLKIKDETETIKELKPDLIVVTAYGKIIPQAILDIPTYGCLNVHASLLPKYRGAACLNAPILNGDTETGVTIMKMEAGLDTGPILRQSKISLNGRETLSEIHDRLSQLGAEILIPTIQDFLNGKIKPVAQDDSQASYIKTLKKEDGRIDWAKSALEIERLIRAYTPWPGAHSLLNGKMVKILTVDNNIVAINKHKIGQTFLHDNKLSIQCGQDSLLILKLQTEGGRPLDVKTFLNGNSDFVGSILN